MLKMSPEGIGRYRKLLFQLKAHNPNRDYLSDMRTYDQCVKNSNYFRM